MKEKTSIQEAREVGHELAALTDQGKSKQAMDKLSPLLSRHFPFTHSGEIGKVISACNKGLLYQFLDMVSGARAMGGWPVIVMALNSRLERSCS